MRELIPHGEIGAELRAVARDDVRAVKDERRLACNRYLGEAVQQWAFCSLQQSAWAREFYDAKIATGKSHHAALRALGNRRLEVLWHCLRVGVLYDEAEHTANRARALKPPA